MKGSCKIMAEKVIKSYKVKQETREVIAYSKSLTEKDKEEIKEYSEVGYKVIRLDREKPAKRNNGISKEDLRIYLKDKIDNKTYKELLEHLKSNENFLKTKSWLKKELQNNARNSKDKKYIPFNVIVATEKENEKITSKANAEEYIKNNKLTTDNEEETSEDK